MTGTSVSDSRNRGIVEKRNSGILHHRNGGSESPGILILYSIVVFVFIKHHHSCFEYKKLRVIVNIMTKYTFGIYLCHLYVLKFWELVAFRCFHIDKFMLLYRMTTPFVVIPVAIIGIYIMRKIPVVSKIVP